MTLPYRWHTIGTFKYASVGPSGLGALVFKSYLQCIELNKGKKWFSCESKKILASTIFVSEPPPPENAPNSDNITEILMF